MKIYSREYIQNYAFEKLIITMIYTVDYQFNVQMLRFIDKS